LEVLLDEPPPCVDERITFAASATVMSADLLDEAAIGVESRAGRSCGQQGRKKLWKAGQEEAVAGWLLVGVWLRWLLVGWLEWAEDGWLEWAEDCR